MSQAFPPLLFLALAPAATWMLAHDLRRRIATLRYSSVAEAEHPVEYWFVTLLNMLVVMVSWYQVAAVAAAWLSGRAP